MKTKLFITILFLLCGFVAYANNSLERKIEASREYQSDLAKANDKLRAEKSELEKKIKPLRERFDKVEWRINENKKLWQSEEKKILDLTKNKLPSIYFTSYNPEKEQTDNTPCVAGGTGANLCELSKTIRTIALSQDLVSWTGRGKIKAGTKVILKSTIDDDRCNGEFIVLDSMNKRFKWRGDIFFMNSKDNVSCVADVYITNEIIKF